MSKILAKVSCPKPKLPVRLLFAFLSLLPAVASSANSAQTPHVEVRLVPESKSVKAGDSFTVAFDFKVKPGWHIYWLNPGDSGEPIKVKYDPPFSASRELQFPLPQKIPFGPLVNFGYEHEAILLAELRAPKELGAKGEATLTTHLSWLVCQEDCIPEKAELSIPLPVRAEAPAPDLAQAPLFSRARAMLPAQTPNLPATLEAKPEGLNLIFSSAPWQLTKPSPQVYFFPQKPGLIEPAAPQALTQSGNQWKLALKRGALGSATVDRLDGVLKYRDAEGKDVGVWISASPLQSTAFPWEALGFAFLGGLLLNLMPCVFPVLSIKILHWAKKGGSDPGVALRHALVYGLGILISFWILAGLLLALRYGGSQLGWGFHLQSPRFIAFLALLFFFLGLSFLGVFEIGASWLGLGNNLTKSSAGYRGSFFTGVLATVVATPCLAPFMGPAIGVALTQKTWVAIAIFSSLALGMAVPYIVLTAFPGLLRRMPKPGRWMETLQQILGFFLFATLLWLLWVLGAQAGIDGIIATLGGMLLLGFGLWTLHRGAQKFLAKAIALIACAAAITLIYANVKVAPMDEAGIAADASLIPWKKYSPQNLEDLRKQGKPVFLNFTAAWCITCKVNEKLVLNRPDVVRLFSEKQVTALKGDWTNQDATIAAALAGFGRQGVPLYVLYKSGEASEPKVLPQILTQSEIIRELENL